MTQWPDNNSDHARVYKWLKTVTVGYRFRPGEQLMIGELAERLRVSSTPVRETLIRLQAESLLDTTPRRGFFAKTLNLKEMIDLFQFRFLLLKSSIERAAELFDVGPERTVLSIVPSSSNGHEVASSVDTTQRPALDKLSDDALYVERVSESIVAGSQNDVAMRALSNVNDRTHYVRMIDLEVAEPEVRWMMEELLHAVEQNDTAAAIAILKRDLDHQIKRMPALVKEGIGRAYTSPSWALAPSQLDRVPPVLSRALIAGKMAKARP